MSQAKDFSLVDLSLLCFSPLARVVRHWWLRRVERHYLICAEVEQTRMREAQQNLAYYQRRAALARSERA